MCRRSSNALPGRPVLQFNRIDFRLGWFRRHFPNATILHLYRHPRDQWCSSLVDLPSVPREMTMRAFEPHDHYYLRNWAGISSTHIHFLMKPPSHIPTSFFTCSGSCPTFTAAVMLIVHSLSNSSLNHRKRASKTCSGFSRFPTATRPPWPHWWSGRDPDAGKNMPPTSGFAARKPPATSSSRTTSAPFRTKQSGLDGRKNLPSDCDDRVSRRRRA